VALAQFEEWASHHITAMESRPAGETPLEMAAGALEELTAMGDGGRIRLDLIQALVALNRRSPADYRTVGISREKRGRPPADNCHGVLAS
jgi:hypothetical protein